MMIDKFNRLSGSVDPTAANGGTPQDLGGTTTAGVLSTNWLDLTVNGGWLGEGTPLCLRVSCMLEDVDVTSDPDATMEIQVISIPRTSLAVFTFVPGDVSTSADTITETAHGLTNGTLVEVSTTTTLPTGLAANTHYFVVGATANTFQLSLTPGGAAVDITATGAGTHTITFFPTILGRSDDIPLNRLVQGDYIDVPIGFQVGSKQPPLHRYVFARFIPSGTLASGQVFADIVPGTQHNFIHGPSGFTVQ